MQILTQKWLKTSKTGKYHYAKFKNNGHLKKKNQKVGQHTWGNRLIHGSWHRKDNQLPNLELPYRTSLICK